MSHHNRFIDKLYVKSVPNETKGDKKRTKTQNKFKLKNIKIFHDNDFNPSKTYFNRGMGYVIMQSWNTSTNIPKDIGICLDLPMIVDRKKIKKMKMSLQKHPSGSIGRYKGKEQGGFKMNNDIIKIKRSDYLGIEQIRYAGEKMMMNTVGKDFFGGFIIKGNNINDERKNSGNKYKYKMLSTTTQGFHDFYKHKSKNHKYIYRTDSNRDKKSNNKSSNSLRSSI